MTIWAVLPAAQSPGQVSSVSWLYCVLVKSERSFVWMPHVLRVTGATGTIFLNCAGLSRRG